jgi:DNA-directed RNA polymerase specialized sigma subunit
MKIFSPEKKPAANANATVTATAPPKSKKTNVKKEISESEIREKLAANTEISSAAKQKSIQSTQKLGEGFMKSDDHLLKTDVQINDPQDPVTAEKLKSVLANGAFSFNSKERDVLSRILKE